jgi:hypothetical protein
MKELKVLNNFKKQSILIENWHFHFASYIFVWSEEHGL